MEMLLDAASAVPCYAVQCEQHALSELATNSAVASSRRKLVLPTRRLIDHAGRQCTTRSTIQYNTIFDVHMAARRCDTLITAF